MTTKKEKVSDERVQIVTKYPGPSTYATPYDCSNCGWSGNLRIDKGFTAPATKQCPTCECATAKKALSWTRGSQDRTVRKEPLIPLIWPEDLPPPWPKYPPDPWPPANPYGPGRRDIEKGCPICARKDGTVHGCMPPRVMNNRGL